MYSHSTPTGVSCPGNGYSYEQEQPKKCGKAKRETWTVPNGFVFRKEKKQGYAVSGDRTALGLDQADGTP
jgi:hypothetical protein